MSVVDVITWTCAGVFILTAIITLLSVVNLIKIEPKFREKLFYSLLVEVVACSVLVFKNSVTTTHFNMIRITNPSERPNQTSLTRGKTFFVLGICKKEEDATFDGKLMIDNKVFTLENFKIGEHDIFTASTDLDGDTSLGVREGQAIVKLIIKKQVLSADSVRFKLLTQQN